jgi:hypothetical protein
MFGFCLKKWQYALAKRENLWHNAFAHGQGAGKVRE